MKNRRLRYLALAATIGQRIRLERWSMIAVVACFCVSLIVILLATQLRGISDRSSANAWIAGTVATADYVVEQDFQYVDEKATQLRRAAQANLVPPVFAVNATTSAGAQSTYDNFAQLILNEVRQGSSEEKVFLTLQVEFPDRIARADLRLLLALRDLSSTLDRGRDILNDALLRGIADVLSHEEEAASAGAIEIRRVLDGRVESEDVPIDQVLTLANVADQTASRMSGIADPERKAIVILIKAFAVGNAFYDEQNTILHRNRALSEVTPVTEKLSKGQVLVRRGDLITDASALMIKSLGGYTRRVDANGTLGSALFLLALFILAVFLFSSTTVGIGMRRGQILLILGMGFGFIVISAIVVRFVSLPDWLPASLVMPMSALAMLVAILISIPVGIVFTLVSSLAILLLTGMNIQGFLFALLSGIAATAVVLDAEKRIDLVRAGLLLSLADALILLILGLLSNAEPGMVLTLMGTGIGNGFLCGILTLGFLPIFELLLNAPTRFKLMELSDLNSPIFKRMLSQAPGTYTHSISVANLAETACEAIGANALLARVSAYYHDIGKVDQADYFVENQKSVNKHDAMRPSLSVAVIKSHVRIGIEKARELNLPQAIIDIIAQHHGRGLITYFYHRAVKEGKNPRVSRDDYSYPGVRPKTKEAAVLMLADSVEAASRTLKKPTEARLESFVQDMIMEKFSSGELGDSNLTLRDLELIRKSFVHILEGYFHTRIEYPKVAQAPGAGQ